MYEKHVPLFIVFSAFRPHRFNDEVDKHIRNIQEKLYIRKAENEGPVTHPLQLCGQMLEILLRMIAQESYLGPGFIADVPMIFSFQLKGIEFLCLRFVVSLAESCRSTEAPPCRIHTTEPFRRSTRKSKSSVNSETTISKWSRYTRNAQ